MQHNLRINQTVKSESFQGNSFTFFVSTNNSCIFGKKRQEERWFTVDNKINTARISGYLWT